MVPRFDLAVLFWLPCLEVLFGFSFPRQKREEVASVRAKFIHPEGDHFTLLAVLKAFLEVPQKQRTNWCSDNFINIRWVRVHSCYIQK